MGHSPPPVTDGSQDADSSQGAVTASRAQAVPGFAAVLAAPRLSTETRRLTGVEDMVISLSAKGLTHGEIAAHLAEVYGAEVSKQTITTITNRVMDGLADWATPGPWTPCTP